MKNKIKRPELSDIEWLAFCYLANELPADERDRFEKLLESDNFAQDALVSMMALSQSSVWAFDSPTNKLAESQETYAIGNSRSRKLTRRSNHLGWWLVIASSLFLALGIGAAFYSSDGKSSDSDLLADAWLQQIDEPQINDQLVPGVDFVNDDLDQISDVNRDAIEKVDEGDWLLAALIALDEFDDELFQ